MYVVNKFFAKRYLPVQSQLLLIKEAMEAATAAAAISYSQAVQGALTVLTSLNLFAYRNPVESCVRNNSRFDYIIVGGGTSGCVLANRLSEDPNVRVLLLDAGTNFDIISAYPGLLPYTRGDELNWNYGLIPNENYGRCHRSNRIYSYVGKVLGGTSSIDYMLYSPGTEKDYNKWAEITNEPAWSYPNVLRLFKKIERFNSSIIRNSRDAAFHGFNGMVGITKDQSPANEKYYTAYRQTGKRVVNDINPNSRLGATGAVYLINNGIRQSSAETYLTPAGDRPNLFVVKQIQVTKILFNRNKRAVGVVAIKDNVTFVFGTNREIIISAGVLNTPKLLQLSGVGTIELLTAYNIPPVSILPVGLNYRLRVATAVSIATQKTNCKLVPENNNPGNFISPTFITYDSVNNSEPDAEYRTVNFLIPLTPPVNLLRIPSYLYDFRNDIVDYWYRRNIGRENLFSIIENNYPKARGQVVIQSLDPFGPLFIDPQIYSPNVTDLDDMVSYVKDYLRILDTPEFKKMGAYFVDPTRGSCGSYETDGDDYWRCYVQCLMLPVSHQIGTASLGSVVDGRLRVKGVKGLRVADASIIPFFLPGSPTAPTMMIGENAAEMIKEDNKQ